MTSGVAITGASATRAAASPPACADGSFWYLRSDFAPAVAAMAGDAPRSYWVNFAKSRDRLPGFVPAWTLERGCEEIARWLRDGGLGSEAFDSRRFIRLKQLKHLLDKQQVDQHLRWDHSRAA